MLMVESLDQSNNERPVEKGNDIPWVAQENPTLKESGVTTDSGQDALKNSVNEVLNQVKDEIVKLRERLDAVDDNKTDNKSEKGLQSQIYAEVLRDAAHRAGQIEGFRMGLMVVNAHNAEMESSHEEFSDAIKELVKLVKDVSNRLDALQPSDSSHEQAQEKAPENDNGKHLNHSEVEIGTATPIEKRRERPKAA